MVALRLQTILYTAKNRLISKRAISAVVITVISPVTSIWLLFAVIGLRLEIIAVIVLRAIIVRVVLVNL